MEIVLILFALGGVLVFLSGLGWFGKLLNLLGSIFAEGLSSCVGCFAKLGIWAIILLLILAALGLLGL